VRSLVGSGIGWLSRLWTSAEGRAPEPGVEALLPLEEALGTLESLLCAGAVHWPASPASAAAARRAERGRAGRNAFGQVLEEEVASGPAGVVSVATGMALAGLRATAFLGGDQLLAAHAALAAAAERRVPLVLHATHADGRHDGYHRVAGSGCFQLLAASGQEAIDLSLVARWLAERALVPGLVATDGIGIERLRTPDEELARTYLGAPDDPIASPTEAQRILFGTERPRALAWFDPDRPVATGGLRGAAAQARARLGGRLFFWDPVRDLAQQGMEELARLTGRPLSFVSPHHLDDADLVLVTQGGVTQAARAVADHLRRARGRKVGVLGVTWLRPLPLRELAAALGGRGAVAVVECVDEPLAHDPPLLRELRAAIGAKDGWISATCSGPAPDPARLASLCELLGRGDRPGRVRLDEEWAPRETDFPRRDALLQAVANSYPELRSAGLPEVDPPGPDPEGGRSAGLVGREDELPPDALTLFAEAVADACGPCVRGSATRPGPDRPGVWQARVGAAPGDFPDPGPLAPVSVLMVMAVGGLDLGQPLAAVSPRGTVLLAGADSAERVWAELPEAWRRAVRERELRLCGCGASFEAGIEALRAILKDGELPEHAQEVAWRDLPDPADVERELPRMVRRIEQVRAAHDSLPRFWGEVAQPLQALGADAAPDPLTASGVVPAGASALEPDSAARVIPVLDPELCTGCGRCWSACPDAAIGVTALGGEALLTAASRAAGTQGKPADALRRAHKHLAGRLAGQLAGGDAGELTAEAAREAWTWLSGRMEIAEDERPAYEAAFDATLGALTRLRPTLTRPFFHEPEQQKKGTGELLVLAFDPRACLGCGLCVAACPEGALDAAERDPERVAEHAERWRAWEALPDTEGATLARAAEHPEVGPLAAALLTRHCAQAQVGGGDLEPGSGERLAARLVTSLVESHAQRRMATSLKALEASRDKLDAKLRERLGEGLAAADPGTLAQALTRVVHGRAALSELGEQLDALGAPATFDRRPVLRMARLVGALDAYRERLIEGRDGLGRARFGVVVARGTVAEWAARFPLHPYHAPLTLAPTAEGVELARGIARGLTARHLDLVRTLRQADLEAQAPPDRSARLEAIEALAWQDLDPDERNAAPPLLLLGDETALLEHGFEALTRLLGSDLPVKVVLLDGRGRLDAGPEPSLVAMAHRRAFVLAGSIAHPEHLARGLGDALAWSGPALIHLHAPSPRRHGFAADAALEQARRAVEGRAHVLFRYDPSAEGLFGLRATLDGNPGPDEDWGGTTFAEWAAGESRFAGHFEPAPDDAGVPLAEWLSLPENGRQGKVPVVEVDEKRLAVSERLALSAAEHLAVWNTLRELTGAAGPFVERVREALEREIEASQQGRLEELKEESDARIAELRSSSDREALARLTERLMSLAGFAAKPAPRGNGT
jgi:pyruvate-ferredoxin/flavodoxin oxidoreductase